MAHVRSPAYPGTSLEVALDRADQIYGHENRAAAAFDVVLGHWGYKPMTGPGQVTLAALRQFGLITVRGQGAARQVQLTQLALSILLDEIPDSTERAKAVRIAALMPKTYAALWKKWGTPLPSQANMRTHLIRDLKFNEKAVAGFLKNFEKTISFAKLDSGAILSDGDGDKNGAGDGAKRPIKVGDFVQWTSQGVAQFSAPCRVTGLSEDAEWAFVEGSETGLPVKELAVAEAPTSNQVVPPRNPLYQVVEEKGAVHIDLTLPGGNVVSIRAKNYISAKEGEKIKSLIDLSLVDDSAPSQT